MKWSCAARRWVRKPRTLRTLSSSAWKPSKLERGPPENSSNDEGRAGHEEEAVLAWSVKGEKSGACPQYAEAAGR